MVDGPAAPFLAALFLFMATLAAWALPWALPGWAVALAGGRPAAMRLVLGLALRARWVDDDERGKG
jgi:hypothetical protein